MIVKKVRNPRKASPVGVRITRLADYIDAPETLATPEQAKARRIEGLDDYIHTHATAGHEKCIQAGARGFHATTQAGRTAEMVCLAQQSVHSKDPISHYVLSWRQGEQPTPTQIEQAVDLFLDELGLAGHQTIYGLHADTDNVHLHLVINRVHPHTLKVIDPNRGFDLEAAHRAVARIEYVQGWSREAQGRYRVHPDGQVQRVRSGRGMRSTPSEDRQSISSVEPYARTVGAPLIRQAPSWDSLHAQLARVGMRYARKGSGALLWVGEIPMKASRAGRACSLSAVQHRLGAYQPAPAGLAVAAPQLTPTNKSHWDGYRTEQARYVVEKRGERQTLRQRQAAERQALRAVHRQQRLELFAGIVWSGRGAALNALRSLVAARQAGERAALAERQRQERAWLSARWLERFPADADWRQGARGQRVMATRLGRVRIICLAGGDERLVPRDIRAFVAVVYGRRVDYRRADDDTHQGTPAFVDRGREIVITDGTDQTSVLAALQLAGQKWGTFQVEGDTAYQALCVRLAATHGLRLGNPALQAALVEMQRALEPSRVLTASPKGDTYRP